MKQRMTLLYTSYSELEELGEGEENTGGDSESVSGLGGENSLDSITV